MSGLPKRNATCHPDRKHKAHGNCNPCFAKAWRAVKEMGIKKRKYTYKKASMEARKKCST